MIRIFPVETNDKFPFDNNSITITIPPVALMTSRVLRWCADNACYFMAKGVKTDRKFCLAREPQTVIYTDILKQTSKPVNNFEMWH